jgi:hypothetical protein
MALGYEDGSRKPSDNLQKNKQTNIKKAGGMTVGKKDSGYSEGHART